MPNHCENHTMVFGPSSDVAEVIKAMTINAETSLSNLVPMPDELRNTDANFVKSPVPPENWANLVSEGEWSQAEYESACARWVADYERNKANKEQYGHSSWYDWALETWGTKWGDYDHTEDLPAIAEVEEVGPGVLSFETNYNTAWSPFSDHFWQQVTNRFPNVRFETRYYEFGMGFAGVTVAYKGVVIDNGTGELPDYDWEAEEDMTGFYTLLEKMLDELYDEADKDLAETLTGQDS